ncbi:MAG: hypothetical protein WEB00_13520 [Dehalococcoidia bacterium]
MVSSLDRPDLMPKAEMVEGKLFTDDEIRPVVFAMLLETWASTQR